VQIKEFELEISPVVQNKAVLLNMCAERYLKDRYNSGHYVPQIYKQSEENITNLDWILKV
jgi:hypothetical protein